MQHVSAVERGIRFAVLLLVIWLFGSTLHFILLPWLWAGKDYPHWRLARMFVVGFGVTWVMTVWSMLMAAFTSPGLVPVAFKLGKRESTGWCRKCDHAKPIRAHHCKTCKTCILRMDHHCPWIGNCVGWRNQGHFIRFLTYAELAMLSALLATIIRLVRGYAFYPYPAEFDPENFYGMFSPGELDEWQIVVAILNICVLGTLSIFVGLLGGFQWRNAAWNMTTIEDLELTSARLKAQKSGEQIIFPFDLGLWRNLQSVFGRRWWAWPLPLLSDWQLDGLGDGVAFEMRSPAMSWPPAVSINDNDDEKLVGPLEGRERFRRGSEGFLIPASEIGIARSAPLLI